MISFSLKSIKSFRLIPHSYPFFTSLTADFSLKILLISPSYITVPSLINLAFDLFLISPDTTFEPATFPSDDTLNTF